MPQDQNILEEQSANSNQLSEEVNENISQEQTIEPSTSNLEPQTQNMEVHHHSDLHTERNILIMLRLTRTRLGPKF